MSYRSTDFNGLRDQFEKFVHKVLFSDDKLDKHFEIHLITAYNQIVRYGAQDFENRQQKTKKHILDTLTECRVAIEKCAKRLNIHIRLPSKLLDTISASIWPPEPKPKPPAPPNSDPIPNLIMADFTYLSNISNIIKKTYAGDPTNLSTFIEAIELAESLSQPKKKSKNKKKAK